MMLYTYRSIVEYIRELYQQPEGFIPLHAPSFQEDEKQYLFECLDSTFVSSVGKFVDQFEKQIADYIGIQNAVACVNGTNGLHLALLLVDVKQNTEVLTQPLTFVATANAISYCGAHPVFLDVDEDTMGLSPRSLLKWLENCTTQRLTNQHDKYITINKVTGRRIAACMPVHSYGHPCRIDEVVDICHSYNIPVVEDAAESLGSYYKHQHTGTFGDVGVLSFNGNKVITTGGGGMLLFKDTDTAERARYLSAQAKKPHKRDIIHDEIGYNYRMPNINAALGLGQLTRLSSYLDSKRRIAACYEQFFRERKWQTESADADPEIMFISEPPHSRSNYWLNCILMPNREFRDEFLTYCDDNDIMTRPAWKLLNELKMYKDCQTDELCNATMLAERLVNIPSSALPYQTKLTK